MGRARFPHRGPAGYALLLVDQHDDLAADGCAAVVQLQVFALVLIAGGCAIAGGEEQAILAYQISSHTITASSASDNARYRDPAITIHFHFLKVIEEIVVLCVQGILAPAHSYE